MAIETRVHNVWNNLIESASHATGSLMIWDTGEYEVRPRYSQIQRAKETDDEISADSDNDRKGSSNIDLMSEPEKLRKAFQDRHVHLRLHGTRLPPDYTIAMRLPRQNYRGKQPGPPKRRRRKKEPQAKAPEPETTDSDTSISTSSTATSSANEETAKLKEAAAASDDEDRDAVERELTRANNAYPGATNDIGSIHQRQWFLSLDREASGFVKERSGPDKGRWVRTKTDDGTMGGFETFFVQGREVERSIITGRMAMDIMDDAGMKGYKGRKMWRAITE
ncbi:hypothetical protein B9Z65_404 [Elsinoe australis]|uniref:DNA ligase D 3'-phosphoesterase domain-containing protein n=1 Tax=Elsinoe australis TaxID=40998 RepID=A0A2P7ZQH6_9PEZI|nr:hypothetical protein B9Z65_404 [Elsinoe australis]